MSSRGHHKVVCVWDNLKTLFTLFFHLYVLLIFLFRLLIRAEFLHTVFCLICREASCDIYSRGLELCQEMDVLYLYGCSQSCKPDVRLSEDFSFCSLLALLSHTIERDKQLTVCNENLSAVLFLLNWGWKKYIFCFRNNQPVNCIYSRVAEWAVICKEEMNLPSFKHALCVKVCEWIVWF